MIQKSIKSLFIASHPGFNIIQVVGDVMPYSRYHLTDGTRREEQGVLKSPGTADEAISVSGSYTWVDLQGVRWIVTFTADENGFHPHVSQGVGLPASIVASLLG